MHRTVLLPEGFQLAMGELERTIGVQLLERQSGLDLGALDQSDQVLRRVRTLGLEDAEHLPRELVDGMYRLPPSDWRWNGPT